VAKRVLGNDKGKAEELLGYKALTTRKGKLRGKKGGAGRI